VIERPEKKLAGARSPMAKYREWGSSNREGHHRRDLGDYPHGAGHHGAAVRTPDETEEIIPVGLAGSADEVGTMSPDEIARTPAAMDRVEPFQMTEEERAAIEADRRARKEWEGPIPRARRPAPEDMRSRRFLGRRDIMSTVKATVRHRRIEVIAPDELPDGTEVLVEVTPISRQRIGIRESEWRDDPEALADWDWWIQRIEPIELTPEEQAGHERFEEEFRRYNIEAVRKQMEGGAPG
jgi:hypothetical protein